jgi:hypothetical protein
VNDRTPTVAVRVRVLPVVVVKMWDEMVDFDDWSIPTFQTWCAIFQAGDGDIIESMNRDFWCSFLVVVVVRGARILNVSRV